MWSLLLGQRKRIKVKVEPGPAEQKQGDAGAQKNPDNEKGGDLEETGGCRESLRLGGHEGRRYDGSETIGQQRDLGQRSGPGRGPSMPEIFVQRPPVPFSSGPYPEALPSELASRQKHGGGGEGASGRGTADSDHERRRDQGDAGEAAKGGARAGRGRGSGGGDRGDRPGGWVVGVWRSFRTAISGRK